MRTRTAGEGDGGLDGSERKGGSLGRNGRRGLKQTAAEGRKVRASGLDLRAGGIFPCLLYMSILVRNENNKIIIFISAEPFEFQLLTNLVYLLPV